MSKGNIEQYEDEKIEIKKSSYFDTAPDIKDMPGYKLVSRLVVKDMMPFIDSKNYKIAHGEANFWEQKMFPKGFKEMAKFDESLPEDELAGANDPKGMLLVSKKVPVKNRREVVYHEWIESLVRKELRK